jgi:hypothetical protein
VTDHQRIDDRHRGLMQGFDDAERGKYNDMHELVAPLAFLEGYQSAWDVARPGWADQDRKPEQ